MSKSSFAIIVLGAMICLSACIGALSTQPAQTTSTTELSPPPAPGSTKLWEAFWSLTPNKTSEAEVVSQLGEPNGREEALQSEWTWLYLLNHSEKIGMRVTFNTQHSPMLLSEMYLYDPGVDVSLVLERLGPEPIVFVIKTPGTQTGETTQFALAYPENGILAYVNANPPTLESPVSVLYRESPRDRREYLEELKARTDARLVVWP